MTGSGTPTRARADQPRRLFVFVSLFMSDVEEDRWLSQEWCKTGAEAEACPLEGMGSSQLDVLIHRGPPKVGGKSNANVGRECGGMSRARADCPMRSSSPMACFAHVRGLGSPAASHTQATCSGPREPGVAAARRGRFECPRRALAPRLPPPPELRGACGRAACAPRLSARRLSSVSRAARVPPNPQVSERARKARRAR